MITKPTTFVLGAGASKPYGFPLGRDLARAICRLADRLGELEQLGFERNAFREFKLALARSGQPSVDAFLEHRSEFMDVGKAAIAMQLIEHEDANRLFEVEPSWYEYLLNRMAGAFDEFDQNAISIVTFNYDRSLEHYLFTALCNRYGKHPNEVAAKLRAIPIVHVYGQLGVLDWQSNKDEPGSVRPYDTSRGDSIRRAAAGIKIMSEESEDSLEFTRARQLLLQAQRIYFLGFGYHDHNMRRLKLPLIGDPNHDGNRFIGGTCVGFSEEERDHLHHIKYKGLTLGEIRFGILDYLRNERRWVHE